MDQSILLNLALLLLMAVGAQWLAWRIRIPSILILLTIGFVVGPLLRIFNPDELMGSLLFPFVSLSVGIILFEGGLTLRFNELPTIKSVIGRLVSVSALITWVLATISARVILGLSIPISILFGAILIVTGPTVVGPILRQIRPKGRIGAVLKWEGILIDPVGAIVAVLVFEAILAGDSHGLQETILEMSRNIGITVMVGGFLGIGTAALLIFILMRRMVPDFLQNAVILMIVGVSFALSDFLQPESGLITTTVIGIILANQTYVSVFHVEDFTEDIQVMLIGVLFILLSARITLTDLEIVGVPALIFLAVLIFVVRPISALAAVVGSELGWRDWLFASVMAPRGIVAAAVASIFAFELSHIGGIEEAAKLVPLTFVVIVGTVLFYGLTADPIARALGLSERNPQGVVMVGGHLFARAIGKALQDLGFRVMLLDTNRNNISIGKMEGLETHFGNALSEHTLENLDLSGIGRMLALTQNNEINSLAALHFPEVFSRAEVYQLTTSEKMSVRDAGPQHLRGRFLFDNELTYSRIVDLLNEGAKVEVISVKEVGGVQAFKDEYENRSTVLFVKDERKQLLINTVDIPLMPTSDNQTVIALVRPKPEGTPAIEVEEPDEEAESVDEMEMISQPVYVPEEE